MPWAKPPEATSKKQPEKISEKDLVAAIETLAEDEDSSLGDLVNLAVGEMVTRLKHSPGDVGATALMQIINAGAKAKAAQQTPEQKVNPSVLEMVRDSSLPDERKKELLLQERERLQEELELVHLQLEEL